MREGNFVKETAIKQVKRAEGKVMERYSLHQRHLSRPTGKRDQEEIRISRLTAKTPQ